MLGYTALIYYAQKHPTNSSKYASCLSRAASKYYRKEPVEHHQLKNERSYPTLPPAPATQNTCVVNMDNRLGGRTTAPVTRPRPLRCDGV